MSESRQSLSRRDSLRDLYERLDAEWRVFLAFPREEVRAYWDNDQPPGRVQDSFDRQAALRLRINEHPDARDFEADLKAALGPLMASDDDLAREVYASLTNSTWEHENGDRYGASFRSAGGIVAQIRNEHRGSDEEDYLTWYCSAPEGRCTERVAAALAPFGWKWRFDVV